MDFNRPPPSAIASAAGLTLVVLFIVGATAAIGFMRGRQFEAATFQQECIKRGVAEYDSVTGQWKWTVEKKSEVSE